MKQKLNAKDFILIGVLTCLLYTSWLIRRLYVPKGWFTPPFETAESLRHRLEETFGPAKVRTVQSMASFVCRKAKEKHP